MATDNDTNGNTDNPREPMGGAGGVPEPKRKQKHAKLPFLTRRQTYHFIIAIPVIQLGLCFLFYLIAATELYRISYPYIIQLTGFSLLTGVYQWYMARLSGSCISVLVSVYALMSLNIINVLYLAINFSYFIYGAVLAGVGLLLAVLSFRK